MNAVRRFVAPGPEGLGMSARRITVSTVGLVPGINKLAAEDIPVTFALSLHAPDDGLRNEMIPVNTRWNGDQALDAAYAYFQTTGRRVSIEYALIKDQLDKTGLFKVKLQSTEWVQYSKDRTDDVYPMYQLGWFPDYSDADNYLVPFFYDTDETPSFLANHYRDKTMNKELNAQSSIAAEGRREEALKKIQGQLADELPTLPLLQGNQIAVSGKDVKGVDDTLDPAFQFRLALLSK